MLANAAEVVTVLIAQIKTMGWQYFNENPAGRSTGDCVVRAISIALSKSWDEVYTGLCLEGFILGNWGNGDEVWRRYLRRNGFRRHIIPDECPYDCMTVERFANKNPEGTYILSMPERHVVTVIDGVYFDSWDSGNEIPIYYFARSEEET